MMQDRDKENRDKELEAFRESFKVGLNELIENAEVFLDIPRPPDPESMSIDERTLDELSPEELVIVRQTLYEELGVDPQKKQPIRAYSTTLPGIKAVAIGSDIVLEPMTVKKFLYFLDRLDKKEKGEESPADREIQVAVYETNRDGIFLQELVFPDGEKRWVLGPDQDI